jgi:hypothetical protein
MDRFGEKYQSKWWGSHLVGCVNDWWSIGDYNWKYERPNYNMRTSHNATATRYACSAEARVGIWHPFAFR